MKILKLLKIHKFFNNKYFFIGAALSISTGSAHAGLCTTTSPGKYICEGAAGEEKGQNMTADNLHVITIPGFGISNIIPGNALSMVSTNGLTFIDTNDSTISGQNAGISATNSGGGALSLTMTGHVTGRNNYGIRAINNGGTDLIITAKDVSGNGNGAAISADNRSSGQLSINTSGDVVSENSYGIRAFNTGTDLSIIAKNVSSLSDSTSNDAILASNTGSGSLSITTTGELSASGNGILAINKGTDLKILTNNISGGANGISAVNHGTSDLSITTSGKVTGANGSGINATNAGPGALSIETYDTSIIEGNTSGILASTNGSNIKILNTGTVQNTSGQTTDIAIKTLGGFTTLTNNGTVLGAVILSNEGNSLINNGSLKGKVSLGNGPNTIELSRNSKASDIFGGSGSNIFTVQENADFSHLDGGSNKNLNTLIFDNATQTLTSSNTVSNFGLMKLENTSSITSTTLSNLTDSLDGIGQIDIDRTSLLTLSPTSSDDYVFNHLLTGAGKLRVEMENPSNSFDFSAATNSKFTGVVQLVRGIFNLSGANTSTLTNSTLIVGKDNITSVGLGNQKIAGLAFDGGTLNFGEITPGQISGDHQLNTSGSLDLSGSGNVQIAVGNNFTQRPHSPNASVSLLQQDGDGVLLQLAGSQGTVTGSAGNLTLVDQNGKEISDAVSSEIFQNGETVANGIYDYRLTSGTDNDGLYVNYGLTGVELLSNGAKALVLNAEGNTGNAADLSAKVTGTGDLAFSSLAGQTVSLSNESNDYTGVTDLRSGNLLMLNDNVLGNTSRLSLAADTLLDMNGNSQTIVELSSMAGSVLNLNGGSMTLAQGGTSAGELTGSGELTIAANTLTVHGSNSALSATTTIAEGAQATLDHAQGLGFGKIVNAGKLVFSEAKGSISNTISGSGQVELTNSVLALTVDNTNFDGRFVIDDSSSLIASSTAQLGNANINNQGQFVLNSVNDWQLNSALSGTGELIKQGQGTLTLTDQATYTGDTNIQQGTLTLGAADAPIILASQQINITQNGTLSGFGGVAGNIDNAGQFQLGSAEKSLSHTFTVGGDLTNSGVVSFGTSDQAIGNQLIVKGDYHGDNGQLQFNTVLGDDSSVTDKLWITGNTSGNTSVSVSNAGGSGLQTLNGIELINVAGTSSGVFTQIGRIAAGAYDYTLVRGSGSNNGNWYLSSQITAPVDPANPKPEGNLRPEGGSYVANLAAANTMFEMRMHDRLGDKHYFDVLTGQVKPTNLWVRQSVGRDSWHDSSNQLKTKGNRSITQIGTDLAQWSQNGQDSWTVGLMTSYGHNNSRSHSSATGHDAKGSVNGYSVGGYATWFANNVDQNGSYVDTWIQYGHFKNTVKGDGLSSESYTSKGLTASIESGYKKKVAEFKGSNSLKNEVFVEPQAQATWMGIRADDHREVNGTLIKGKGEGNLRTRIGMRAQLKMDKGTGTEYQPFVEANWFHNTRTFATSMDGVSVNQSGIRNFGELRVGVEGQVTSRFNLSGNIGVLVGESNYTDRSATLGVKYSF